MGNKHSNVITDQEDFFNQNSLRQKIKAQNKLFFDYTNKVLVDGFRWLLQGRRVILEYGCGTGTSLDLLFKRRDQTKYVIYGVDIAAMALAKAREKYPKQTFYRISKNKIPQLKTNSIEAAYMFHVLHHTRNHKDIFKEIYSKLQSGSKFLICDLTSRNIINRICRFFFVRLSEKAQDKFSEDLVVHGHIPEKYEVDVDKVASQLEDVGFLINEVGHAHLFFFAVDWLDKFIPLSKLKAISLFYKRLIDLENYLLRFNFFQQHCEVFYIKCIKK